MTRNVVCMRWGDRYGPEYVNRLRAMVARRLSPPHRFVCLTDDPAGLDPEVEALPMPDFPVPEHRRFVPWPKIGLFEPRLHDLEGPALFLDLDVVVVGRLDPFFEHMPGRFCVIRGWGRRNAANTSVFRFEVGSLADVAAAFRADAEGVVRRWRNSQSFVSDRLGPGRLNFWPDHWCRSFKHHCLRGRWLDWALPPRLPPDARVVVFHGRPKPPEALAGYRAANGRGWPVRPAPWVAEHWR